ncbi:MAG: sensor histidine kinase [Planctomycetota bacterium]|jgi:signal transduction histidine kinase
MNLRPDRPQNLSIELLALLVITVIAASGPALIRYAALSPSYIGLVICILVHCAIGTYGWTRIEQHPRRHLPYLIVQSTLALLIIYLAHSYSSVSIIIIPLAAQAGILLERRAAIIFAISLTLLDAIPLLALGVEFGMQLLAAVFTSGTGIFFGVLFAQVLRSTWRAKAEVERLNTDLAEAARQSAALATAEERNRIAREIHDSVGHALTTVHVQLTAAEQMLEVDQDKARDLIDKARGVTDQGLQDVRRAVTAMRQEPLPMRIDTAIGELAEKARQTGLSVKFDLSGEARDLPGEVYRTVYRVAQEALTNVRKHGEGEANMALRFGTELVELSVRNPAKARENGSGGFGLLGLRERAALVNGQLQAGQENGHFDLNLEIPLP